MWIPGTRRGRGRRRAKDLVGLSLAGVLLVGLAACGSQGASTRSGVAAPILSSSAPGSSGAPVSSSGGPLPCYAVSGPSPTRYVGAAMMPDMTAVLDWIRAGSTARGTLELSGNPELITEVPAGSYPLCISFVPLGDSFNGNLQVKGRPVPISGQLTASGVDLEFDASSAMNPTLSFRSIGPGSYSYAPSYPPGYSPP